MENTINGVDHRYQERAKPVPGAMGFLMELFVIFCLIFIMGSHKLTYLAFSRFTIQIFEIMLIGISFLYIILFKDYSHVKDGLGLMLILCLPIIWLFFSSFTQWIVNLTEPVMIRRGVINLGYMLLVPISMCFAGMAIGRNLIRDMLLAIAVTIVLIIADVTAQFGIRGLISGLSGIFSGVTTDAVLALEEGKVVYAAVIASLYICMNPQKPKGSVLYLLIFLAIFVLSWKRAAFVGAVLSFFLILIIKNMEPKALPVSNTVLSILIISFAFFYIFMCKSGLYEALADRFDIDTMGRVQAVQYIRDDYSLSPFYFGYGYGYINEKLNIGLAKGEKLLSGIRSLHNDVLSLYVESGTIGFAVWYLLQYVLIFRLLLRYFSSKSAKMWMVFMFFYYVLSYFAPVFSSPVVCAIYAFIAGTALDREMDCCKS